MLVSLKTLNQLYNTGHLSHGNSSGLLSANSSAWHPVALRMSSIHETGKRRVTDMHCLVILTLCLVLSSCQTAPAPPPPLPQSSEEAFQVAEHALFDLPSAKDSVA